MSSSNQLQPTPEIFVLGVGNILLGDEGLGVHAVRYLLEHFIFEPEIEIIDGGTMGMELIGYIKGAQKLLLIDAISSREKPGTILHFEHEDAIKNFNKDISAHEIGIQDILFINSLSNDKPINEVNVIGMPPESLEPSLDLSKTLEEQFPAMIDEIIAQLSTWGISVRKKD
ncbi:MAG: HyaD/HybD family hydrogenase maturation endopeptidase [Coriobacteriia bacterium]|nr:HyaD/HybD family hydrogenase maturation endopeptidase [Coriobacteriia bacterium]